MAQYWVVGGEYADTSFKRMVGGKPEERIGPFDSYEAAKACWQARAWATVDNAQTRYRIEESGCDLRYWVVGCSYTDTRFCEPAEPGGERWYGPFDDFDSAKAEWTRLAWASVDDAHARFRIERRAERRGFGT
jgi:hypothetical protein